MSLLGRVMDRAFGLSRNGVDRAAPPAAKANPAPDPAPAPARISPTDTTVRAALSLVDDPEVGVDIVNLGLVRGWEVEGDRLHLRLTATSPACPVGPQIVDEAQAAVAAAFPDHIVTAELAWDPPWRPADMTPRARAWLGHAPPPEEDPLDKTLDIRPIAPRERHPLIFQTFGELTAGDGFVLVNDHDPKPLFYQFQAEEGSRFGWEYLERGPETWRVRISRVA